MLRAYDKATGEEVGEVLMPAPQTGSPDDLHAERCAVSRARDWRQNARRTDRVQAAIVGRRIPGTEHTASAWKNPPLGSRGCRELLDDVLKAITGSETPFSPV